MHLPSYIFSLGTVFLKKWKGITAKAKTNVSEIDKEIHVQMFKEKKKNPCQR